MSALPREPKDFGYVGLRLTADEFFALGETEERLELIDGVVQMAPSPSFPHQRLLRELLRQFERYLETGGSGEVVPDIDVQFSARLVYRPDLVYYGPGRLSGSPERLTLPPDLVIEIVSPGTKAKDFITKRDDYDRFGVAEYWTVDPDDGSVRCWRRQLGAKRLLEVPVDGDSFASTGAKGFVLDLRPLRALARWQT
jgi:Uma2 family endonuclease